MSFSFFPCDTQSFCQNVSLRSVQTPLHPLMPTPPRISHTKGSLTDQQRYLVLGSFPLLTVLSSWFGWVCCSEAVFLEKSSDENVIGCVEHWGHAFSETSGECTFSFSVLFI